MHILMYNMLIRSRFNKKILMRRGRRGKMRWKKGSMMLAKIRIYRWGSVDQCYDCAVIKQRDRNENERGTTGCPGFTDQSISATCE